MKAFAVYTLARFGVFAVAFGLVWLVMFNWLAWNSVTVLWTMLIALVISAIASAFLLRGMRERLALTVQARAEKLNRRIEESQSAEDVD